MKRYSKLIAAVVGLLVTLQVVDSGTAQDISAVLTAFCVYLFPND
jgi:hypothetical protein